MKLHCHEGEKKKIKRIEKNYLKDTISFPAHLFLYYIVFSNIRIKTLSHCSIEFNQSRENSAITEVFSNWYCQKSTDCSRPALARF